jgi:hypothetical protein
MLKYYQQIKNDLKIQGGTFMFKNIGRKIKGLVKTVFIIQTILAVVAGIAIMTIDEELIVVGALVMIILPIIFWISSWLLYGYGELIDKVSEIAKNTKPVERPVVYERRAPETPSQTYAPAPQRAPTPAPTPTPAPAPDPAPQPTEPYAGETYVTDPPVEEPKAE